MENEVASHPSHLPTEDVIRGWSGCTVQEPLRVLVSGCLFGIACGYDGTSYGTYSNVLELLALPNLRGVPFCPEHWVFGTPRDVCNVVGGDGFDVLAGRARVLTEAGEDWTERMVQAAHDMLAEAQQNEADLALLMDVSAACGSQVIYDGPRHLKRYRKGPGVCAALLIQNDIPVVSQRDYRTLIGIYEALSGQKLVYGEAARDHHESDWYRGYFGTGTA